MKPGRYTDRYTPEDIRAYRDAGLWSDETLFDLLARQADARPDKVFATDGQRSLSYRELHDSALRLAAGLDARGWRTGDTVAVQLPNWVEFIEVVAALSRLGIITVPIMPIYRRDEVGYVVGHAEARAVITPASFKGFDYLDMHRDVRTEHPGLEILVVRPDAAALVAVDEKGSGVGTLDAARTRTVPAASDLPAQPSPDDPFVIVYTSGTTSRPKGCVHTQRDMLYTAGTSLAASFQLSPDDVVLNFVPIFWIAGEDTGLLFPLVAGATLVLMARWDAVGFMTAVERHKASFAYLLVDNAVEILDHPRTPSFDLTSLRKVRVLSFVKKLNPDFRARWRALTGADMIEAAWGMTETHTMDSFTIGMQQDNFDLLSQPVFVGLPVPGTDFKICDFDSGALMPLGETGEICVRTPSLFKGYWNKPEASAEAIRNGFLHTGDIGVIDEQGYLHFLGRRKEMLKVKGMSVFPAEIEAMLGQHPDIAGSGVIGREDAERGQVPVAFIALGEQAVGLDEAALSAWCRERMAGYKVPEIRLVKALPMTATGKVKKEELRTLL